MEKDYLKTTNEEQQLDGVSIQTFVRGYKEQSQLHVHEINRANLSSEGRKIMKEIHRIVSEDE